MLFLYGGQVEERTNRGRKCRTKNRGRTGAVWIGCSIILVVIGVLRFSWIKSDVIESFRWEQGEIKLSRVNKELMKDKFEKLSKIGERLHYHQKQRKEQFRQRHERRKIRKKLERENEDMEKNGIENKVVEGAATSEVKSTKTEWTRAVEGKGNNVSNNVSNNGIPAGARTHGKVAAFEGCVSEDKDEVDIKPGVQGGMNIKRISYTLYKVIQVFGITSLGDSPAGDHSGWMSCLARRLMYERPFLQYVGIDSINGVEQARKALKGIIDGRWEENEMINTMNNNSIELLFHWPRMKGDERDARHRRDYAKHIAQVVRSGKNRGIRYIIIPQFPSLRGPKVVYRHGRWLFDNHTQTPFLMNHLVRGVVPVEHSEKNWSLYLTLYSVPVIEESIIDQLFANGISES